MGMPSGPDRGLGRVTLCAVTSRDVALSEVALLRSSQNLPFARVVLFSPTPPSSDLIEHVQITEFKTVQDYSRFVLFELGNQLQTDFALIIHFDGFVVNPVAWEESFLEYDYIGARWPWHTIDQVGNGGFCLRSLRLLNATASSRFDRPGIPEDELICRVEKNYLETDFGFRFAPNEVADRFSMEHAGLPKNSFGFHGLFHMHHAYAADELEDMLQLMNPSAFAGVAPLRWLLAILEQGGAPILPMLSQAILAAQPPEVLSRNCIELQISPVEVAQVLYRFARELPRD